MVRDVIAYGVLGAVVFLFLCGVALMDDGSLLPPTVTQWARGAYHFLGSPLAPPPPESEPELIPQGLVTTFLGFSLVGFFVHLIKTRFEH